MKPKMILAMVLAGLVALIILQNTEVVSYRFLLWEFSLSRIILLPLLFAMGLIIGYIFGRRRRKIVEGSKSILDEPNETTH